MNFNKKVNMNNINKKFGKMGLIFLISVLIFSCFNNKEKVYTETVDGLFDTVHVISGYDKSKVLSGGNGKTSSIIYFL